MWKKLHHESRQLLSVRGTDMVSNLDFTLPVWTMTDVSQLATLPLKPKQQFGTLHGRFKQSQADEPAPSGRTLSLSLHQPNPTSSTLPAKQMQGRRETGKQPVTITNLNSVC